jgi:hypothetical protein
MGNMSYCRFQNTLLDLKDCFDALCEGDTGDMSPEEQGAMNALLNLCQRIAEDFNDEVVDDDSRSYGNNRRR